MSMEEERAGPSTGHPEGLRPPDDEISLWEVLAVLIRRRGWIVASVLVVAALAGTYAFIRAETFTTAASFRPQGTEATQSQLMSLASQFGVNVGGLGEELSPAFYAELLTSRGILMRVVTPAYEVEGVGKTTLPDLLEIEEDTEALRLEAAVEWLRDNALEVETGRETGVVTLRVQTQWPDLSATIAERLLDEVSRFNMDTRQSQAAAERKFIEERVDSAQASLREAESELQAFLQANRQFQDSPDLMFQHDRLQRTVQLRQQVFTTLVQSFEQARISEVRDTPVITVLQAPFLPPGPDERRLLLFVALGLALGGMGGVVLAFVVEAVARPVAADPAREDFQQSWEGLLRSFGLGRGTSA
jgi:uncharacterized protein involved in exopolysaccharide biosynthesis